MPYISKKQLERLQAVAATATMETASFGWPQEKFVAKLDSLGALVETTPDEFIKERTRCWRRTWITAPILQIIHEIESKG